MDSDVNILAHLSHMHALTQLAFTLSTTFPHSGHAPFLLQAARNDIMIGITAPNFALTLPDPAACYYES